MSDMSCSLSLSITKTNSKTNTKTKTTDVLWRPPRLFNVLIRLLTKSPREGGVGLEYLHLSGGKPEVRWYQFYLEYQPA